MLIDEVVIKVKAGRGGDGSASFRREKYVPKGGPDGGDGGKGGDIYLVANPSTHGLANYKGKKNYEAESGGQGHGALKAGKNGEDLYLSVPPGTKVTEILPDGNEQLITDLVIENQTLRVAQGGKGGWGNDHFKSATNQAPKEFNLGKAGQEKTLRFELQLIADVGLIGLPNAGKSTLLSVISNARPKVADYPFTTLEPNLGMVTHNERQFVASDIPGLIEGAAAGKGLGHEFLKHILRTNLLVHLIPATELDAEYAYQTVRRELADYDPTLTTKKEIVVLSKIDIVSDYEVAHRDFIKKHKALCISSATREGVKELLDKITQELS